MSVDGASSNESCFQNCIDGTTNKPPPPPLKSKQHSLLNQYTPVKSSQQINISTKRTPNKQIMLSKKKHIGKGAYAVSDTESDIDSPPPPLEQQQQQPPRRQPRLHSKSVTTQSIRSVTTHTLEPGQEQQQQEEPPAALDEFEVRAALEETLKAMQMVPDHMIPLAVNEAWQTMKMNQQQKQNFPPIVKTTIEKYMPPDEIRKFYQQDDLMSAQQFTKIKGYLLNTTALATTAFNSLHITNVGTRYLHDSMKEFVNDPNNRVMFDEFGQYIRGTIFDSPLFSLGSSFVGVVRESHDREMRERKNMATIEEEEETVATSEKPATTIGNMEASINEFKKRNTILDVLPPTLLKKKPPI